MPFGERHLHLENYTLTEIKYLEETNVSKEIDFTDKREPI